jgi:hypothetical protein
MIDDASLRSRRMGNAIQAQNKSILGAEQINFRRMRDE